MSNKIIYITSAPRTGNNFLTTLINSYLITFPELKIKCINNGHQMLFLKNDNSKIYNFMVIRDPKDVLLSQLIFSYLENEENNLIDRINDFINNYNKYLETFENANKNNNYWILFEDLIKNPELILKKIIELIGETYNPFGFIDPIQLANNHLLYNNIYKNPFPRNIKTTEIYKKLNKTINTVDLDKAYKQYKYFIDKFEHKQIS